MERKILDYVNTHKMLEKGDGIVVGVSGGADSMSLLLFLMSVREEYQLRLKVVHINHGIRGESASRDEAFVRTFCEEQGLDCLCVSGDIPKLAEETGTTEEEAGRNFRYKTFESLCTEGQFNKIAVAHNRDDNAETVLFNLFRGSGIAGVRGIAPVKKRNGFTIIRPLLCVSRAEIEGYLKDKGVGYCTDETNLQTEYSRNRIRLQILPYVRQQINEGATRHIAEFAAQAGEMEEFLEDMTTEHIHALEERNELTYKEINGAVEEITVDCQQLHSMNRLLRRNVIRRLVSLMAGGLKDIESKHIEAVDKLLEMGTGKRIELPYRIVVRRDYNRMVLAIKKEQEYKFPSFECVIPGEYRLNPDELLRLSIVDNTSGFSVPKNDYTKCYDYDKIKAKIYVRSRQTGDYLLIGQGKRKSLKNYFIDSKIDRVQRDNLPLLAEGNHILWIIGCRRDDSCFVTDETKTILLAEIIRTERNSEA